MDSFELSPCKMEVATYEVLCNDTSGRPLQEVVAEFSTIKFNRVTTPEIERTIAEQWQIRSAENPRIFDGSKFRLHSVHWANGLPTLCLGLTSYREFLGTNCCPQARNLQESASRLHGNPQAYMSDALGVGAFVLTTDDKFVFLKRSHTCSEARGLLDRPGGHAEPDMIPDITNNMEVISKSKAVINEIFDSIIREVRDEVNIPKCQLSEPALLGIVKNHTTAGRASAEFLIRCKMCSEDVANHFNEGIQSEVEESTGIQFHGRDDIIRWVKAGKFNDYAPACIGAMLMYANLNNTH